MEVLTEMVSFFASGNDISASPMTYSDKSKSGLYPEANIRHPSLIRSRTLLPLMNTPTLNLSLRNARKSPTVTSGTRSEYVAIGYVPSAER